MNALIPSSWPLFAPGPIVARPGPFAGSCYSPPGHARHVGRRRHRRPETSGRHVRHEGVGRRLGRVQVGDGVVAMVDPMRWSPTCACRRRRRGADRPGGGAAHLNETGHARAALAVRGGGRCPVPTQQLRRASGRAGASAGATSHSARRASPAHGQRRQATCRATALQHTRPIRADLRQRRHQRCQAASPSWLNTSTSGSSDTPAPPPRHWPAPSRCRLRGWRWPSAPPPAPASGSSAMKAAASRGPELEQRRQGSLRAATDRAGSSGREQRDQHRPARSPRPICQPPAQRAGGVHQAAARASRVRVRRRWCQRRVQRAVEHRHQHEGHQRRPAGRARRVGRSRSSTRTACTSAGATPRQASRSNVCSWLKPASSARMRPGWPARGSLGAAKSSTSGGSPRERGLKSAGRRTTGSPRRLSFSAARSRPAPRAAWVWRSR